MDLGPKGKAYDYKTARRNTDRKFQDICIGTDLPKTVMMKTGKVKFKIINIKNL